MGTKVTLDIRDDDELRNLIKDMIRGQVISIVRAELKVLVKEITQEEIGKVVVNNLKPIVESELRTMNSRYGTGNKLDTMIAEAIKKHVDTITGEGFETRVYHRAVGVLKRDNEALKNVCQEMVDASLKEFFKNAVK